jgi:integrase
MMLLGLRPAEAAGLVWADVDLDSRILHVRRQRVNDPGASWTLKATKTRGSTRSLRMPDVVVESLYRRRQETLGGGIRLASDIQEDFVFATGEGTPLDRWLVADRLRDICQDAGLDRSWTPRGGRP